jgi:Tfp pilus assembly protein PilO
MASLGKTWPKLQELERKITIVNNDIANIQRYKGQIEDLRGKLSLYKKKFSTEQQISLLLKELSDIAKNSGVKIVAIKPYPAVTETQQSASLGAYQKFPISITAICGYHQLGTFLSELENGDIFMRITDMRITADNQNPVEHNVHMIVNTYILTESV